jgi:tetratricopeptide (TPR) repeat protein
MESSMKKTRDDLKPVIERYYQLVKAGKFDEASELFRDEIEYPTYYHLSDYHLQIRLLKELFPDGEDSLPRLQDESMQAKVLNDLAAAYSLSGQPAKAVPLLLMTTNLYEKIGAKIAVAICLGNVSVAGQVPIGQLSAAAAHLRKRIALGWGLREEFVEAVGRQELGRVLAFRGDAAEAAEELNKAFELSGKLNKRQNQGLSIAYRSLSALLQTRLHAVLPGKENQCAGHVREALSSARRALAVAEQDTETRYPHPRDFVRAYWLLGEALLECHASFAGDKIEAFDIHFYDRPFQEPVETLPFKKGNELNLAERCLNDALRRCRNINIVDPEPAILLALARLEQAKNPPGEAEPLLKEALDICLRSGYRLILADLHLLCGQILVEDKGRDKLLDFTVREHLQKAKDYALDVSEFSHLYQSPDPQFYHAGPEYDMLRRGMTDDERIKNGYYVAYKIAEALEKGVEG